MVVPPPHFTVIASLSIPSIVLRNAVDINSLQTKLDER
jgi:hypothetical protein